MLPPNFDEVPAPNSKTEEKKNEDNTIKKILKVPNTVNDKNNNSSTVEESILEKIRK